MRAIPKHVYRIYNTIDNSNTSSNGNMFGLCLHGWLGRAWNWEFGWGGKSICVYDLVLQFENGYPFGRISSSIFASLLALLVQRPAAQDGSASWRWSRAGGPPAWFESFGHAGTWVQIRLQQSFFIYIYIVCFGRGSRPIHRLVFWITWSPAALG